MMGMSACNRYSPSWEEDADGTKQESLQSVLGIPDIIGTEIDNAALLRSVTDSQPLSTKPPHSPTYVPSAEGYRRYGRTGGRQSAHSCRDVLLCRSLYEIGGTYSGT